MKTSFANLASWWLCFSYHACSRYETATFASEGEIWFPIAEPRCCLRSFSSGKTLTLTRIIYKCPPNPKDELLLFWLFGACSCLETLEVAAQEHAVGLRTSPPPWAGFVLPHTWKSDWQACKEANQISIILLEINVLTCVSEKTVKALKNVW